MIGMIAHLLTSQFAEFTVSLLVLVVEMVLLVLFGYVRPNVRHSLLHTAGSASWHFFIRNLDSHRYAQMKIEVGSKQLGGLESIAVHAGPWGQRVREVDDEDDQGKKFVAVFQCVPEDAVFGVRVMSRAEPVIDFEKTSKTKNRSFSRKLESFDKKMLYFGVRFFLGIAGFVVIQLGVQLFAEEPLDTFEIAVSAAVGVALAAGSFALVVPTSGKRTILGYLESRPEMRMAISEQPKPGNGLPLSADRQQVEERGGEPLARGLLSPRRV